LATVQRYLQNQVCDKRKIKFSPFPFLCGLFRKKSSRKGCSSC
jgi:hypothetical protein